MDLNELKYYAPLVLNGVFITIALMVCSLVMGLLLSSVLTALSFLKFKPLNFIIWLYTFIIRGTPLLVQIFLIYYGSAQFECIRNSFLWHFLKSGFGCTVIALSLNSSGYCVVLFRGLVKSIPQGEFDACLSLGMSKIQMIYSVILSRLIRIAIPSYSNEVAIILKSTSLASTITIMDLMGVTKFLISATYATLPCLFLAGCIYLLINFLIIKLYSLSLKKIYTLRI